MKMLSEMDLMTKLILPPLLSISEDDEPGVLCL